jgi:esterase/lipase superfamily enzyme
MCGVVPAVRAQSTDLLQAYQKLEAAKSANETADVFKYGDAAVQLTESAGDQGALTDLLKSLGEYAAGAHDDARSVQYYGRALVLEDAMLGPDHPDLVPLLSALADLAVKDHRYPDAEAILQRIVGIETMAYGERHANVIASLKKLREVYAAANDAEGIARVDAQLRPPVAHQRGLAPAPGQSRRYQQNNGFATVRVFYGTNRAPTGELSKPALYYGPARDHTTLHYGYLDVTIPQVHQEAELETQPRWAEFTLDTAALRTRYVLLETITPLPRDEFARALHDQVAKSPAKDVFIFVHGFNVTFEDAARRTAQLAYDMDFDGTPMLFSWPSAGSITSYFADEAAVNDSGFKMAEFLDTVVAQSGAQHIHLIAHSMGNRALIEALQTFLSRRPPENRRRVFGQILFTAPDVDRDYFTDAIQALRGSADRITLYASGNDYALRASQFFHHAPRAGTAGDVIVRMPDLDTIDMSAVPADMLGHSYFAVNSGAIFDIFNLFLHGNPPPQRCGMNDRKTNDALDVYWFNVDACKGSDLLQAGITLKRYGDKAREHALANIASLTDPSEKQEWQRILDKLQGLVARPAAAVPANPASGAPK